MKKSLFNYYTNLSEPVKASLWFTFSSVIQKGIALLSTPIFTRLLSTEQYGVYSVYQSWYAIITIFTTLNLYAGVYNNGMTKWPDRRPQYTSALLGLSSTISIIWFLIYLAAMDFWNELLGLSSLFVLTMFAEILFVPAYNFWSSGQRYDYKYRKLVAISLFIGAGSPLLGIVAVLSTSYKAEAQVLSYALIQICVGLIFYIHIMRRGRHFFIKDYWIFALKFNIPLIPHYLAQTVLNQADRIMIANMVGNGAAAIYSVAYSISMMFTIVTTAINNTFIPYTYKAIRDQKYQPLRNSANFLCLLIGGVCIVAMAFGPEIIRIFASPEYYEARWVVPPVAESVFFMFVYPLFCNIEFYYEQTLFIMIASGTAAAMNVGLNYIFIGQFGYLAAAYTTLACYIFLTIAHYIAYKIICRKKSIHFELYDIRFITGLITASLAVMFFMTLIYDHIVIRYAIIAVIAAIAFIKRNIIREKLQEMKHP